MFDTGQQYLGSVYAKSLLGAGEKAGNSDALLEELEGVVEVLGQLPNLAAVLESPRVPLEVKERTLDGAFAGKVAPQLLNFLKVVARRGRFDCLTAIAIAARQQLNSLRGRVEVHVESAEALDDSAIAEITTKLQARLGTEVDLRTSVDPDLIAGLVVRVGDTVYDGSLSNRLLKLRDDTVRKARQATDDLNRFATAD